MTEIEKIRLRLRIAYLKSGMSYKKLEEVTGVGHSIVQRYFSGETKKIALDDFIKICYAVGCDPRDILGWTDKPTEPKIEELTELAKDLPEAEQNQVLEYARYLADRAKKQ